jgi:ABC-type protease/lipase transport system fused ATPase/permease subunit
VDHQSFELLSLLTRNRSQKEAPLRDLYNVYSFSCDYSVIFLIPSANPLSHLLLLSYFILSLAFSLTLSTMTIVLLSKLAFPC